MNNTKPITNILQKDISYDIDPEWLQFLRDHKNFLIKNSILTPITPNEKYRYRYRLREYVKQKNISVVHTPVVCIINDISSHDFNHDSILLPNENVLNNLRSTFKSSTSERRD
jgi:hypothetical protein